MQHIPLGAYSRAPNRACARVRVCMCTMVFIVVGITAKICAHEHRNRINMTSLRPRTILFSVSGSHSGKIIPLCQQLLAVATRANFSELYI